MDMATEEQKELLDLVMREASITGAVNQTFPTKLTKSVVVASFASFILLGMLLFFDIRNKYTDIVTITTMLLLMSLFLVDACLNIWAMRNPQHELINTSKHKLKRDNEIITNIKESHEIADIRRCADHLEGLVSNARFRALAIAGKLWELGTLPAVIVFYLTYYVQAEAKLPDQLVPAVVVIILGSYLMGLIMAGVTITIESMVYLLRCSLQD